MHILLTGVAGFIGSHMARHLLAAGHSVLGLDDLSGGFERNVPAGVEFVRGDIGDRALVEALFEAHRFDGVAHLAAYAAEGLSPFVRRFNYRNNLLGSLNLLVPALQHGTQRFLFTSSIAVYGHGQVPMHEGMTPAPSDPYGIAKYAFELELAAARRTHGLQTLVFRPHNVYGEGQNVADPYRNVVGIFMRQALAGEPLTVFGDGSQTRAFSHIDEVAPVLAGAFDRPEAWNSTYNIGADTPYSVLQLANEVQRALGTELPVQHLAPRDEVEHAWADHSRVRDSFGAPEPVALADGLERMAKWVREVGVPKATAAPAIELRRGLPEGWS